MIRFNKSYFLLALLFFITEVLIALYLHDPVIRPYGGDFLVVILIYCFVMSFLRLPLWPTCIGVLLFAYAIEIGQYYHLIDLLGLTNSRAAQMLLGTSFYWTDMLAYTLGIVLVLWIEIKRKNKAANRTAMML